MTQRLVLSSTSPARKLLLKRLQLPFEIIAPDVDETPLTGESPVQLVKRLAQAKAQTHANQFPQALVIGCDQVAVLADTAVSKPLTHENAVQQLLQSSGQKVRFLTGLCLYNTATQHTQVAVEHCTVVYRLLTLDLINRYLEKEQPYHCAGSIKAEGLGITLFERILTKDPTTLTGLPLIRLVKMLENEGVQVV